MGSQEIDIINTDRRICILEYSKLVSNRILVDSSKLTPFIITIRLYYNRFLLNRLKERISCGVRKGDLNTRFFHNSTKAHKHRSKIYLVLVKNWVILL